MTPRRILLVCVLLLAALGAVYLSRVDRHRRARADHAAQKFPERGAPELSHASPSAQAIVGIVEAADGTGLQGARVDLRRLPDKARCALDSMEAAPERTALTGKDGSFRFADAIPQVRYLLTARSDGLAPDCRECAAGESIVLRLRAAAAIAGVVEDTSGLPVPGAEVIAWEAGGPAPFETLRPRHEARAARSLRRAFSDERGAFRIDDVEPGSTYTLVASTARHVTSPAPVAARAGDGEVRIRVAPLHLTWLRPVDPRGNPIERSDGLRTAVTPLATWKLPLEIKRRIDYPGENEWRMRAAARRWPGPVRSARVERDDFRLWFAGPPLPARFRVRIVVPGCKARSLDVEATPVASHPGQPLRVHVEPKAAQRGRVRVEISPRPTPPLRPEKVMLQFRGRVGEFWRLACEEVSTRSPVLVGLPADSYSLHLYSIHPGSKVTPRRIRIDARGVPTVRVELPALTPTALEFETAPGSDMYRLELLLDDEAADVHYRAYLWEWYERDVAFVPGSYMLRLRSIDGKTVNLRPEPATLEVGSTPVSTTIRLLSR